MKKCNNCSSTQYETDKFCSKCGDNMKNARIIKCLKCKARVYLSDKFCTNCGENNEKNY